MCTCTSQVLYPNLGTLRRHTYGWIQLLSIARERAQSAETEAVVRAVNAALEAQSPLVHVEYNTDDIRRLEAWLDLIWVLVDDTIIEQTDVGNNVPTKGLVVGTKQCSLTWKQAVQSDLEPSSAV